MMTDQEKMMGILAKAIITNTEVNAHCMSYLADVISGKKVDYKKFSNTYSKLLNDYNKKVELIRDL